MHFSLFAILSGLAALAVVGALPAENLQRGAPSANGGGGGSSCTIDVSPTFHANE